MKNLKEKSGITLIALVITIIVLLILAGVTIVTLTGDNGLLTKAGEARDKTEISNAKEQVQAEIISSYDSKAKLQKDILLDRLRAIGAEIKGTDFPLYVKFKKGEFTIDSDGNIDDLSGGNIINTAKIKVDILNKTDAEKLSYYQELYGKTVDYEPVENIQTSTEVTNTSKKAQWKIFYADEKHIYLIADSYVTFDSLPIDLNADGTVKYSFLKSTNPDTIYRARFSRSGSDGILAKYAGGIADINNFSKASTIKALNNDFFNIKCLTGTNANGTSYISMKAVASMMDNAFWDTKYKDSKGFAEYTIGGPSIEMLFESYNQTHGTHYGAQAYQANETNSNGSVIANADGYKICRDKNKDTAQDRTSSDWQTNIGGFSTSRNETYNTLYISEVNNDNAESLWIASPATVNSGHIFILNYGGSVTTDAHDGASWHFSKRAFRPLICLKSNVKLVTASEEKKAQGIDFELK